MGNQKGNHLWKKGISANPSGRPKGSGSLAAYYSDPNLFEIHHMRWWRFCWGLMEPPYTGAAAARKAGYSPKSARFIASRLLKKFIIREMLRRMREKINGTRKISEGVFMIPDDKGGYHIYGR